MNLGAVGGAFGAKLKMRLREGQCMMKIDHLMIELSQKFYEEPVFYQNVVDSVAPPQGSVSQLFAYSTDDK
jgi:hypothetical protein